VSHPAHIKTARIKAYMLAYLEEFHPEVLKEAKQAARQRWNEEYPDDPWTGRPGGKATTWTESQTANTA
jgi:hypothetical protein